MSKLSLVLLSVVALQPERRRAGYLFTAEPTLIDPVELGEDELGMITDDPLLAVTEVENPDAADKAAADKAAADKAAKGDDAEKDSVKK